MRCKHKTTWGVSKGLSLSILYLDTVSCPQTAAQETREEFKPSVLLKPKQCLTTTSLIFWNSAFIQVRMIKTMTLSSHHQGLQTIVYVPAMSWIYLMDVDKKDDLEQSPPPSQPYPEIQRKRTAQNALNARSSPSKPTRHRESSPPKQV